MTICNTDKFFSSIPKNYRVIGLDLGDKKIGVSISDKGLKIASPFMLLERKTFSNIAKLLIKAINKELVGGFIIGWPLNMNGSEGPRCDSTRDFAYAFLKLYDIPICFYDERLSSVAIDKMMINSKLSRKKREQKQDSIVASWILQSALDLYNNKIRNETI